MASSIDATLPVTGNPTTVSVRGNFSAAKTEIEALQAVDVTHTADIATNVADIGTNTSAISAIDARTLTAGAGLTGGGTFSTSLTFNAIGGTGITVNADDIALDLTYADARYLAAAGTASDASLLNGQAASYYLDSTNLTGTIASARLSGSYANVNAGQVDGKSVAVVTQAAYDALAPADADTLYFIVG